MLSLLHPSGASHTTPTSPRTTGPLQKNHPLSAQERIASYFNSFKDENPVTQLTLQLLAGLTLYAKIETKNEKSSSAWLDDIIWAYESIKRGNPDLPRTHTPVSSNHLDLEAQHAEIQVCFKDIGPGSDISSIEDTIRAQIESCIFKDTHEIAQIKQKLEKQIDTLIANIEVLTKEIEDIEIDGFSISNPTHRAKLENHHQELTKNIQTIVSLSFLAKVYTQHANTLFPAVFSEGVQQKNKKPALIKNNQKNDVKEVGKLLSEKLYIVHKKYANYIQVLELKDNERRQSIKRGKQNIRESSVSQYSDPIASDAASVLQRTELHLFDLLRGKADEGYYLNYINKGAIDSILNNIGLVIGQIDAKNASALDVAQVHIPSASPSQSTHPKQGAADYFILKPSPSSLPKVSTQFIHAKAEFYKTTFSSSLNNYLIKPQVTGGMRRRINNSVTQNPRSLSPLLSDRNNAQNITNISSAAEENQNEADAVEHNDIPEPALQLLDSPLLKNTVPTALAIRSIATQTDAVPPSYDRHRLEASGNFADREDNEYESSFSFSEDSSDQDSEGTINNLTTFSPRRDRSSPRSNLQGIGLGIYNISRGNSPKLPRYTEQNNGVELSKENQYILNKILTGKNKNTYRLRAATFNPQTENPGKIGRRRSLSDSGNGSSSGSDSGKNIVFPNQAITAYPFNVYSKQAESPKKQNENASDIENSGSDLDLSSDNSYDLFNASYNSAQSPSLNTDKNQLAHAQPSSFFSPTIKNNINDEVNKKYKFNEATIREQEHYIADLEQANAASNAQVQSLQIERRNWEVKATQLEEALEDAQAHHISSLNTSEQKYQELLELLEVNKNEKIALNTQLETIQSKRYQLEARVLRLESDLVDAQTCHIALLEASEKKYQELLEINKNEKSTLDAQLEETKTEKCKLEIQVNELKIDLRNTEARNVAEIARLEAKNSATEQKLKDQSDAFAAAVESAHQAAIWLDGERTKEIKRLNIRFKINSHTLNNVNEELKAKQKELEVMHALVKELEAKRVEENSYLENIIINLKEDMKKNNTTEEEKYAHPTRTQEIHLAQNNDVGSLYLNSSAANLGLLSAEEDLSNNNKIINNENSGKKVEDEIEFEYMPSQEDYSKKDNGIEAIYTNTSSENTDLLPHGREDLFSSKKEIKNDQADENYYADSRLDLSLSPGSAQQASASRTAETREKIKKLVQKRQKLAERTQKRAEEHEEHMKTANKRLEDAKKMHEEMSNNQINIEEV